LDDALKQKSFQGGKGRIVNDPALFLAKQRDWRKIHFA
jgi:hypothetical protein